MPNDTGPQIQVKDKRNPFIRNTTYEHRGINQLLRETPREQEDTRAELLVRGIRNVERNNRLYNRNLGRRQQEQVDTGYVDHQREGILSKPKGSAYTKGDYTGATRAPHPTVRRHFGPNTRATVYPFEKQGTKLTGVLDNRYDPRVLSPPGNQSAAHGFLPRGATPIQAGSSSVLRGVKQLAPGKNHWLFS